MVLVQVLAFGRVQDNRSARKSAKAAKLEKSRKEKLEKGKAEREKVERMEVLAKLNEMMGEITGDLPNGTCKENGKGLTAGHHPNGLDGSKTFTESEGSLTETSEEEMMI